MSKRKINEHFPVDKKKKTSHIFTFGRGNWCGPGWTAGQSKDTADIEISDYAVPALFPLDEICKDHDLDLFEARTRGDVDKANKKFEEEASKLGIEGNIYAKLVEHFGPSVPNKRSIEQADPQVEIDNIMPNVRRTPPEPIVTAATTTTAKTSASAGVVNHGETPIDKVHREFLNPWKKTSNAIMPFVNYGELSYSALDTAAGQAVYSFRINSIYDIITTYTYTADPPWVARSADGTIQSPMLYKHYKTQYKYWSVTSVDYDIEFWNKTTHTIVGDINDNRSTSVWMYLHGLQGPPTITTALAPLKDYERHYHEGATLKTIYPRLSTSDRLPMQNSVHFTGTFVPGRDIDHEILEDAHVSNWTKFDEIPQAYELMTFILNRTDGAPLHTASISYKIKLIYHCQFKDLRVSFQYPVNTTDIYFTDGLDMES